MSDWDAQYGDDEYESRRQWPWLLLGALVLVALAVAGVIAFRDSGSDSSDSGANPTAVSTPRSSTTARADSASTTTTAGGASSATSISPSATTTSPSSVTTAAATSTTAAAPATAVATTAAAAVPDTVAPVDPNAPTTVAADAPPAAEPVTYNTLADGTPAPVIAVFGPESITLSGAVPDQAAKDRLQALAIANSKVQVPVNNLLTIDPNVPIGIGVRVIELSSARFPEGSFRIAPEHATELDRITSIMNALPQITALIIGHADQIGNSASNYALSAKRAAAVVDYLVISGIVPSRLSSRAVGDSDLLTLNDDEASLALNRRTEVVFYGLLDPG